MKRLNEPASMKTVLITAFLTFAAAVGASVTASGFAFGRADAALMERIDRLLEKLSALEVRAETGAINIHVERPRTHEDNVREVLQNQGLIAEDGE